MAEIIGHDPIEMIALEYVPVEYELFITQHFPIGETKREQRVYDNIEILHTRVKLDDSKGIPLEMEKEIKEMNMVLVYGMDMTPPRRYPTELIYHGKKLKNKFNIPEVELTEE